MPVADLVGEWFDHELLRAAIAAPALTGTMLGPRSAGSSLVLLMREAHRQLAGGSALHVKGGPGAATRALAAAARAAGAEIRTSTVSRADRGRATTRVRGVIVGGQTIEADVVVSSADPKTTFLRLIEPSELAPDFAAKMQHYRAAGTLAKVNLALASLPAFGCAPEALTGRIQIGPDLDYLERAFDHAKYGEFSSHPWLELTIPSLLDADLAPPGAHVASIYVHYAPRTLRATDWDTARDALLEATSRRARTTRAGHPRYGPRGAGHHPAGPGAGATDSPAATSSTASWRSTSCSRCGRCWGTPATRPRSVGCTCVAPAPTLVDS